MDQQCVLDLRNQFVCVTFAFSLEPEQCVQSDEPQNEQVSATCPLVSLRKYLSQVADLIFNVIEKSSTFSYIFCVLVGQATT